MSTTTEPGAATGAQGPALGRVVRSEFVKILTVRMSWGLAAAAVVLVALLAALVATLAGSSPGGSGANAIPPPDTPGVLRLLYGSGFSYGYLFTLALGVIGGCGEYRHLTLTASLLAVPRRAVLVTGKLVAYALAGLAVGAAAVASGVAATAAVLLARGYPTGLDADGVPRTVLLSVLGCAVWGVVGVGVGLALRNQIAALVVALASQLLLENLLVLLLTKLGAEVVTRFLPSTASAAVVAGSLAREQGRTLLPWWGGALVLTAYGLVAAAVGAALLRRRDVS